MLTSGRAMSAVIWSQRQKLTFQTLWRNIPRRSLHSDVILCLDPVFNFLPNFSVVDTHAMRKPLAPDSSIHCGQNGWLNLCVFLYLLTRYMRPEGSWQRLAAALADSSAFLTPFKDQKTCPQPLWVILGQPYHLLPVIRRTKEKISRTKGRDKRKIQSRAGPARLPRLPTPVRHSLCHPGARRPR